MALSGGYITLWISSCYVKELIKEKVLELKRGNLGKEVEKLNQLDLPSKRKSSLISKNVKQRKVGSIPNAGLDGGKHANKDPVMKWFLLQF